MVILTRKQQARCFKELVEILKVLAKAEGAEATDAIKDAYEIGKALGVKRDLDRVARGAVSCKEYRMWTDLFCLVSVLETVIATGR